MGKTNVLHRRSQLESLLDMLPGMYENMPDGNRVAAGAAVKGVLAGLVRFLSVKRC